MIMHKALHQTDDVYRLYVTRKEGERVLVSIEDSVDSSLQRLKDYMKKEERLITESRTSTENIRSTEQHKQGNRNEKQTMGGFF